MLTAFSLTLRSDTAGGTMSEINGLLKFRPDLQGPAMYAAAFLPGWTAWLLGPAVAERWPAGAPPAAAAAAAGCAPRGDAVRPDLLFYLSAVFALRPSVAADGVPARGGRAGAGCIVRSDECGTLVGPRLRWCRSRW